MTFKLLGDKALGWLDTIGYDEETGVRVAKGNKGSTFVFNRQTDFESRRLSEAIEYDELVEGFDEGKISGRTGEGWSEATAAAVNYALLLYTAYHNN